MLTVGGLVRLQMGLLSVHFSFVQQEGDTQTIVLYACWIYAVKGVCFWKETDGNGM